MAAVTHLLYTVLKGAAPFLRVTRRRSEQAVLLGVERRELKPDRFPLAAKEKSMGLLDGILGQVVGGGGDNGIVADIAQKVGLTPAEVERAIGALAGAHPQPGDTVETASNATGLSPDLLQQVMGHLGGEGGLASIASGLANRSPS